MIEAHYEHRVAFFPTGEQQRMVAEVERRQSVIEELEAVVVANFQCVAR